MKPKKVFIYYLEGLKNLLEKVEAFDSDISRNRLHKDMLPFLQQAKTAISFSLRCCCPLSNREIISFSEDELTLPAVMRELGQTIDWLCLISDDDYRHMDNSTIRTRAGFADLTFSGPDYFLLYCLPNFMFHYGMVYAIARQAGVRMGKGDFDGYHQYPEGFTFPDKCEEN